MPPPAHTERDKQHRLLGAMLRHGGGRSKRLPRRGAPGCLMRVSAAITVSDGEFYRLT